MARRQFHPSAAQVLDGCFSGATNPSVLRAIAIVYEDYRALRLGGDLIFKLMRKLVSASKPRQETSEVSPRAIERRAPNSDAEHTTDDPSRRRAPHDAPPLASPLSEADPKADRDVDDVDGAALRVVDRTQDTETLPVESHATAPPRRRRKLELRARIARVFARART